MGIHNAANKTILFKVTATTDSCDLVAWFGQRMQIFIPGYKLSLLFVSNNIGLFLQAPDRTISVSGGMQMPAWYDIYDLSLEAPTDSAGL